MGDHVQGPDRTFGHATVVLGDKNGKYPHGNSLVIRGTRRTAVLDPSLALVEREGGFRGPADLVVLSHVHEDHVAGLHLFPDAEVHAHREDVDGIRSMAGLQRMYGYALPDETLSDWLVGSFHYAPRPDARAYEDGAVFELGDCRIRAFHLPGHTRGHCALLVEPEGVLFLGDIDLTGFGPYYGDAWSDLEDFERSLERIRSIPARVWVSFHHVGVIEDQAVFDEKLRRFAGKINERDDAIAEFLREPRTVDEMVAHRFVYPPHAALPFVDAVEKRTIEQHLRRGVERGRIVCEGERYRAV
ncbi:MAG TPA: MBL fold metallo-hydrolase [Candidatus Limnocylindrales bacterium]|nr:MBL fold metallo-hydrolase [Candidatus Limnocylindrales bacterium]